MAKANRKNRIVYNEIEFDSQEELDFYYWIEEAIKYKFIKDFSYNDISYELAPKQTYTIFKQLKTKTKKIEKHLFHPHIYSPDFKIITGKRWELLQNSHKLLSLHGDNTEIIIDTKGTFQKHDGSRSFSMNQKWMFDKYGIYINKIIPDKFFKLTWLPEKCKYSPKLKKLRSKFTNAKTLKEKFDIID